MRFPFYKQANEMDCGATCLKMVAKFYGKEISIESLRNATQTTREGTSFLGLADAAEMNGIRTSGVKLSFNDLIEKAPLPAIIHWEQKHFVVVIPASTRHKIYVADPAQGIIKYEKNEFTSKWIGHDNHNSDGLVLLLEPSHDFRLYGEEENTQKKIGWKFLSSHLIKHKRFFLQLFISLILISLFQVILPFLTQSIVDVGIATKDLSYVAMILFAQLFLLAGKATTEFIRGHILLFIGSRINISILSDFWIKLMNLPLSYFDTKKTGDILQRIHDHGRIQQFLTTGSLNIIFSIINLVLFSFVLLFYSSSVFAVFFIGTLAYFFWVRLFLSQRRKIDYKKFSLQSRENTSTIQLIQGMQEIRIYDSAKYRRWEWEKLQVSIFKLDFKSLSINQYQQAGAFFINQTKNIIILFLSARAVINGELTLGSMLAIEYIIGQLSGPVEQLISFVQQAQDTKLSLERLNEVHVLEPEENKGFKHFDVQTSKDICLRKFTFTYPGAGNTPVLSDIDLIIPEKKTTAIVGMSGSGKTTLLKILLKFYTDYSGEIKVANTDFNAVSPAQWRASCSCVLQDGFIFNDTIANNIAMQPIQMDEQKVMDACRIANILDFVESLPLGLKTKIGAEGVGLSQGQKQRILIARAIYKNPDFLFFDEATNALDAKNEKMIMENLQSFFQNRTVLVVAHRLSTVKNADYIVVLHQGRLVEYGTHTDLSLRKGYYYNLVKNQLELGN
ncbi:peptidase domain-containing ABC transporter [Parasegetibacter sp. NRK P23]|uniref:peptidase domain-containing ABC transporter n=1 Tax=Parasegetibacter sp. NRK P23 TaxID=2942999 RepID=UPI002043C08F|nr:peptidase domain-containing ABC transporter [Parasegetibacter sp. NRK P23]MCM5527873.1 peptidase domain-containing ABC transporter [Parasegetibacter sp. NRK P23]